MTKQQKYTTALQHLVMVLKDEQQVHPSGDHVAALDAVQAAMTAREERKLFRLLQAYERGEAVYFREIAARLAAK